MDFDSVIELGALFLACWIALRSISKPPQLDWERIFKVAMATVHRGEIEAENGSVQDWRERVIGQIPYNPAGRNPVEKLRHPSPDKIPVPAIPGERALVEQLEPLPNPTERYRWMMADAPAVEEALMADPISLGPTAALEPIFGSTINWDDVAHWSTSLQEALQRRFSHAIFVGVQSELARAIETVLPGVRVWHIDSTIEANITTHYPDLSDRFVVFAGRESGLSSLEWIADDPAFRDRLWAWCSVEGAELIPTEKMQSIFHVDSLDQERNRQVPYFSATPVDWKAPDDAPWTTTITPLPKSVSTGCPPMESVWLGPIQIQDDADRDRQLSVISKSLLILLSLRLFESP